MFKKTITLFSILFLYIPLVAQIIQNGLVRELNSDRQPLAGVQITFEDAVPTDSDAAGLFRLAFDEHTKKVGELIFLTEIKKAGYELVNQKDFDIIKIGNASKLGVDIILAKMGTVENAKKEYYQISDKALLAGFDKEKKAIRSRLKTAEVTQQEYLDQLTTLQKQYERQKESLDALAEKFARLNFDDVSPIYEEALKLFKNGNIDEAITKLESSNPNQRTAQIIAEEKRLEKAQADLDAQKAALAQEKEQQIAAVRLLADMYSLTFNLQKAEQQYDQLIQLDSTDLAILNDAANFYHANHLYAKAKATYPKIIQHPKAAAWVIVNAYGHIGQLFAQTGSPIHALENYKLATNAYKKLYKDHPEVTLYKENLATSYERLGMTHTTLGNLDSALFFYQNQRLLFNELYKDYPKNVNFKGGLAFSYEKLGFIHTALGNLDSTLFFYQTYNQLEKELYQTYPKNVNFKNNLAMSYEKLGDTYSAFGNLDSALIFYQNDVALAKELYEAYPQNVSFKNSLAISYERLGSTHTTLGNFDKALTFYQTYQQLEKELYDAYSQNINFKNGLALSYQKMGEIHSTLGNLDTALTFYQGYNQLEKELYEAYPQNVNFKNSLAISYQNLGSIHSTLGNFDKALIFYQKNNQLEKELYQAYPQNVNFKNSLAISYERLGITHTTLKNLDKALTFYRAYHQLEKELYEAYPQNVNFKNGLALSYEKLGFIHTALRKVDSILIFYQAYNQLEKELSAAYPQNVGFKNALASSYGKLGEIHTTLGDLDSALTFYQNETKLSEELYAAYPQNINFKNDLALAYAKLGGFNLQKLNDKKQARFYLQKAEQLWIELTQTTAQHAKFQRFLAIVRNYLENAQESPIVDLKTRIQSEKDTLKIYQLYASLCDTLRIYRAKNIAYSNELANALNSRAWYGFFLQEFETIETDIQEAMSLGTNNKYLATNLPPALLLQGKYDEALAAYQAWMDKPFEEGEQGVVTYRTAFLEDLAVFEKAGVIPQERMADVAAIRLVLKDN